VSIGINCGNTPQSHSEVLIGVDYCFEMLPSSKVIEEKTRKQFGLKKTGDASSQHIPSFYRCESIAYLKR